MKKLYIFLVFSAAFFSGCEKFLDIQPKERVIPTSTEDFQHLLNGGYQTFPFFKGLVAFRSDEFQLNENSEESSQYHNAYTWEEIEASAETKTFEYLSFYKTILYANEILHTGAKKMPESAQKNQIIAEAFLLRAYAHFSLVNLYAKPYDVATASSEKGIPLVLTIDLEQNFPRATIEQVYQQILSDIAQAQYFMQTDSFPLELKFRFSKEVLYAFEARVRLYMKQYKQAIELIQKALQTQSALVDLNQNLTLPSVYDAGETLLALESNLTSDELKNVYASEDLLAIFNKENDLRFGLYFTENSGKYRPNKGGQSNHKMSFRVAELYLNLAEAYFQISDRENAQKNLLILARNRYNSDGFTNFEQKITSASDDDFWVELQNERFRELAFEGHRWFDLRRNQQKAIIHRLNSKEYHLLKSDPRYTIPFPKEAVLNNLNLK